MIAMLVSSIKFANTPIALLREESGDPATVFKLFDVRLLIKSLESAFFVSILNMKILALE